MIPRAGHTYAVQHNRGNAVVSVYAVTSDRMAYCHVLRGHLNDRYRAVGDWVCLIVADAIWTEKEEAKKHGKDEGCEGK